MALRLISEPAPTAAPPIALRPITRPGWPTFMTPPLEVALSLAWLSPIVRESPAPEPTRGYAHVARIFCESEGLGRS
jgi:hypothetical protein